MAKGSPNLGGADTDYVTGSAGVTTGIVGADRYRVDTTHFYEGPGQIKGLTWLASKWFSTIGSLGTPIAASWVPQLTYSMDAGWRTLTVFGNAVQYSRSKIGIDSPPEPGGSGNTFTTQDKYLGIRCNLKDATGNRHITQSLNVGKYDNQREGTGVSEEKENG